MCLKKRRSGNFQVGNIQVFWDNAIEALLNWMHYTHVKVWYYLLQSTLSPTNTCSNWYLVIHLYNKLPVIHSYFMEQQSLPK